MPIRHLCITHQKLTILACAGVSAALRHHSKRNHRVRLQEFSPIERWWGPNLFADDLNFGIFTIGTLEIQRHIVEVLLVVRGLAIERIRFGIIC